MPFSLDWKIHYCSIILDAKYLLASEGHRAFCNVLCTYTVKLPIVTTLKEEWRSKQIVLHGGGDSLIGQLPRSRAAVSEPGWRRLGPRKPGAAQTEDLAPCFPVTKRLRPRLERIALKGWQHQHRKFLLWGKMESEPAVWRGLSRWRLGWPRPSLSCSLSERWQYYLRTSNLSQPKPTGRSKLPEPRLNCFPT